ncbi:MAG: CDP-alcohol phosphatidyltransferase family protein [Verrucomicrobia bacterium]|nr:CDP-alcohol phosphatidyltransferase family protein [Verrucomicrobiota bacterium]MCG2680145.1 CDP-alcohol phosphatidyltransferase family protein [Kiritimatiellia bacterium]MBU4247054.1 CDP-alcohol phosphatidyltransferase family protein [Verrucomicrobiota bacterium]MBU4291128.1 CDP-alcohol phosphatidyltransferase family protein [Verrucomicrobiota bacterium]MBU4429296.1 CDP-alcohol phosphatidyltransferase family protein [Verrucomicrobiota bacterium]
MNWRQILPTIITLAAMLCGFFSILLALEGHENFLLSAQLIMLALILDGLDGNLARLLKGTSAFGAELDTYVDMTAFGLAPAILIYQVSLQRHVDWRILMTAMVVLSGVIRLARFKVKDPLRGQAGYCGLPITASAGWVALFVFLSETKFFGEFFRLSQGPVGVFFLIGVIAMITLQVSNVRYPKPSKLMIVFIPCVVLVALLFYHERGVASMAALIMLTLGLIYVLIGPLFVKLKKAPFLPPEPEEVEEVTL